jgi:guanylate kinase
MDYYFFSVAEFERRRRAGEFIEHATVYGNSYGILKSELLGKLRLGRDVLLNVDVQGAATIRKWAEGEPDLKRAMATVFLTPTSLTELADRLKKRAADSAAVIQKRLAVARREIAQWKHFDYLLVSASVPEDLRRMLAIVEAEKMRVARTEAPEF